jgi:hypothetical protein
MLPIAIAIAIRRAVIIAVVFVVVIVVGTGGRGREKVQSSKRVAEKSSREKRMTKKGGSISFKAPRK